MLIISESEVPPIMDKVEVILDKLVKFFNELFAFIERAMATLGLDEEETTVA